MSHQRLFYSTTKKKKSNLWTPLLWQPLSIKKDFVSVSKQKVVKNKGPLSVVDKIVRGGGVRHALESIDNKRLLKVWLALYSMGSIILVTGYLCCTRSGRERDSGCNVRRSSDFFSYIYRKLKRPRVTNPIKHLKWFGNVDEYFNNSRLKGSLRLH